MTGILASAGNWIDILGGASQLVFGLYLLRLRRGPAVAAFAVFLGLNGLAFLLGNLVPRAHPLYPLLRLTIWGILNWIALIAAAFAGIYMSRAATRRTLALSAAAAVAVSLLGIAWTSAADSVTIVAFGGSAVYSGVAALLVLSLALALSGRVSAIGTALFVALIGINSALHAGVGLVARTSAYNIAHVALITCVAILWLLIRVDHRARFTAAICLLISVALGVTAIWTLKSQAVVQDSGIYGLGRMTGVVLGAFATQRGLLFAELGSAAAQAKELRPSVPVSS